MRSRTIHSRRRSAGFTLIEMVVVITLIAGVLALVAGKVIQSQHKAQYKLAQAQMTTLSASIDQYQNDVGALPDSLQQLVHSDAEGWVGPYAGDKDLKDPWHNAIEYRKPGDGDKPYALVSLGVDGKPGGDGVDKDLVAP